LAPVAFDATSSYEYETERHCPICLAVIHSVRLQLGLFRLLAKPITWFVYKQNVAWRNWTCV